MSNKFLGGLLNEFVLKMLHLLCECVYVPSYVRVFSKSYVLIIPHYTPFAVHYEQIRLLLLEMATNSAKVHSLAPKNEHLRVTQIQ